MLKKYPLIRSIKKNSPNALKKVFCKYLIFVTVKLSATAKGVIGIMAVAGAYRLFQLWKTGNSISYSLKGLKFKRDGNRYAIVVNFDIFNPTKNQIKIKRVTGTLFSGNAKLSDFQSANFDIKPGHNIVPITFSLNTMAIVSSITNAITSKKYPVFDVTTKTTLALFSYEQAFKINTADYAGELTAQIFSDK